jgi:hypothetical protein
VVARFDVLKEAKDGKKKRMSEDLLIGHFETVRCPLGL